MKAAPQVRQQPPARALSPRPPAPAIKTAPIATVQRSAGNQAVQRLLSANRGQPLESGTRATMETNLGHDFTHVRVHTGNAAHTATTALGAHAFTFGRDVAFGPGQYRPDSAAGRQLIAHELTHVIQQARIGARVQRQAAAPVAAPDTHEQEAQALAARIAAQEKARVGAREDAYKIRFILKDNFYLGSGNQSDIMDIVRKWASQPPIPGTKLSPMDYLVAALQGATYVIGTIVDQWTSAFDQMHERMDAENIEEFKRLMAQAGNLFKNEKPIESVKFEITKEDIKRGVKVGLEAAAAIATAGGSLVAQLLLWLVNTLPDLWEKAKAILDLIDQIRNFKKESASSVFSGAALGDLAVRALFGEIQGLPTMGETEPPEGTDNPEAKGFLRLLQLMVRGFMAVRRTYNRVAHAINSIISKVDISKQPWLPKVAAVYAFVAEAVNAITNPGEALSELAKNLQEAVGDFFKPIKSKITEVAGEIKGKLELVLDPGKLLHMLSDKAVEMVLNFIITHPPSEILAETLQIIQTASGKDIIELVREKVPLGDTIIKDITESKVVQAAIEPLRSPVNLVINAVNSVTEKAMSLVGAVESKIVGFISESNLRQLAGMGPAPEKPPEPPAAPAAPAEGGAEDGLGEFLTAVKKGLHARLMRIGTAALKAGAKDLLKKGVEVAKGLVSRAAGAILGRKEEFVAAGEEHELWAEQVDDAVVVMMSSRKASPIAARFAEYEAALNKKEKAEDQRKALEELKALNTKASGLRQLEKDEKKIVAEISKLEAQMAVLAKRLEALVTTKPPRFEHTSRDRPTLVAQMLKYTPDAKRKMSEEEKVSKPITQLLEAVTRRRTRGRPLSSPPLFNAAHLIAHTMDGSPYRNNLVPMEERMNKSYMSTAENATRSRLDAGANLYAVVKVEYNDMPKRFAKQFGGKFMAGKSQYEEQVELDLLDFDLIPDAVDLTIIDLDTGDAIVHESYPPGGPLLEWLNATRSQLGEDAAEVVVSREKRADLLETLTPE
jgi:hypothetical protein